MIDPFVTHSILIVTKPSGEVVRRDVKLIYDPTLDTTEVEFIGESQLKGYKFALLNREIRRVQEGVV